MARIYYVGDWAILLGPVFAESPFSHEVKGTEVFNYGKWLKAAIEAGGEHQVESVPAWDFYRMMPGEYERVLSEYDLLIFSDVEAKNFQLSPQFFDRKQFGKEPLTFPDRVRLTVEAVHSGLPVMFLGGWLSFNGELGKGGWGRTRLAEIMPVECLPYEDLRENTEGFSARVCVSDHPVLKGIDLTNMPPVLGYNIVRPRTDCAVIASWTGGDDPMIAVGKFGRGKTFAYTSDPAPHWGCNLVEWDQYQRLWQNAVKWLVER